MAEGDDLHAQDVDVEVARGVHVPHGEDEVVEGVEGQTKTHSGRKAETIQLGASTISLILRSTVTLHST